MSKVSPFYSANEERKPEQERVYHDNDECGPGSEIPQHALCKGTGGYRLCEDCEKLD